VSSLQLQHGVASVLNRSFAQTVRLMCDDHCLSDPKHDKSTAPSILETAGLR